ncbi:MAG TPA: hypothetical protein H9867_06610 [Candidatus Corynebacterium gallistercoris]|uniref:Uncharacterized protein n=1 Tax=Candidatus Corynebacterium gallistercoris TaxID=2838530 RepID=A0A9D1URJ7_9CORY|nr:hypothetical protein [Candidatus Corynebacterium gallistercoris]
MVRVWWSWWCVGVSVGDEAGTPDGRGRFSRFTGGMMYWTSQTDAWPVTGIFQLIWASAGYEKSEFGYPSGEGGFKGEFFEQEFSKKNINITEWLGSSYVRLPNGKPINEKIYKLFPGQFVSEVEIESLNKTAALEGPAEVGSYKLVTVIPVASFYRYEPNWHGLGDNLNDYCSFSSDYYIPELTGSQRAADFRGPAPIMTCAMRL